MLLILTSSLFVDTDDVVLADETRTPKFGRFKAALADDVVCRMGFAPQW